MSGGELAEDNAARTKNAPIKPFKTIPKIVNKVAKIKFNKSFNRYSFLPILPIEVILLLNIQTPRIYDKFYTNFALIIQCKNIKSTVDLSFSTF